MKTKKNTLLPQLTIPVIRSSAISSHNGSTKGLIPSQLGEYDEMGDYVPFAGNDAK